MKQKTFLTIGGLIEFIPLFDGKRPKYEKMAENKRLLDTLEKIDEFVIK